MSRIAIPIDVVPVRNVPQLEIETQHLEISENFPGAVMKLPAREIKTERRLNQDSKYLSGGASIVGFNWRSIVFYSNVNQPEGLQVAFY